MGHILGYCQMINMEDRFCLNWSGYDENIREYFRQLRGNQRFFDVTLVTDDGQHIQAHKVILSAGSNFFSDIFMKSNHSNMLVYLKGISSDKLEPVIDFIYNGEAFITQEQLKVFIETGKELQVKGLEGDLTGVDENKTEMPMNPQENEQKYDNYYAEKVFTGSSEVAKMNGGNLQTTNAELSLQINEMIEKKEGVWGCKICGKTATTNSGIHRHAEIHIEGMSHICHICSKTFPNRPCLRKHISDIHSELFSCDICGKTGMGRMAYRNHKRRKHNQNIPSK